MNFHVEASPDAEDDIDQLIDFLIMRAGTTEDLLRIPVVGGNIRSSISSLETSALRCRKVADGSGNRELVIPHGATGYIALFRIEGDAVYVLAVRHQRESDYH